MGVCDLVLQGISSNSGIGVLIPCGVCDLVLQGISSPPLALEKLVHGVCDLVLQGISSFTKFRVFTTKKCIWSCYTRFCQ